MKRILITGKDSYIGTSFETWVRQWPDRYHVETIDLRENTWQEQSFSYFDVIYHVAAIVHVNEAAAENYFKVNRDLTFEVAKKARRDGVNHFIFLSTMGVYGTERGRITADTRVSPKTPYAKSKYEAERLLGDLANDAFAISILRPPLVYGNNCPGNYAKLIKLALKLPFFPDTNNERSMIFVDNLSEFVRLVIDYRVGGLLFPQNQEYVNVSECIGYVAKLHQKRVKTTKLFNAAVHVGMMFSETLRKVFGTLTYDMSMSGGPNTIVEGSFFDYNTCSFEESLESAERVSK